MNRPLATRAVIGLAKLLLVMAALLFVPAWTLAWWQAWLFLLAFGATVTWITLYFLRRDPALIERRLKAGPGAEQQVSQKIVQAVAAVVFLAIVAFPGFDHRFGWSNLPSTVVVAGDGLVVLGLLAVFFVFRENSFTSATIEVDTRQGVVSTGPYALVRHPMYSGALVLLAGLPPALGSLWGLLFWFPMVAAMVVRLRGEERYLSENLPGYDAYKAKTRWRLCPGVY